MRKQPAIFLDRDGTLIEDIGVLGDIKDVKFFSDTVSALKKLQSRYKLFVITNQSGVSKGLVSLEQVGRINCCIDEALKKEGVNIESWYVCPHQRNENCDCIKPKSKFVLEAAAKYGLELDGSFAIGDHPHDALTANDMGVFGLYLLTGHGARHLGELPAEKLAFHRLGDAVDWIIRHPAGHKDISRQIELGARLIKEGKTAAFPTETVYGLGADAFNAAAVSRIFEIKGRPQNNPLIVHISKIEHIEKIAAIIPDKAVSLAEYFWPGALTIVLPKRNEIPDIVTSGNPTVAIRMPANPIALELINLSQTPIAAPSANAFTCTSPTTAEHVREQLGDKCDLIIDGGACRIGVESTVISFTGDRPLILRPGGVSIEQIESVIGKVDTLSTAVRAAESPGMMPNHYAPRTPLALVSEITPNIAQASDVGVILFKPVAGIFHGPVEILSADGDMAEAAMNLYAAIRRLDAMGLRQIVSTKAPDTGIGQAINNRLEKAAGGRSI